jgi:cytochrome c553
MLPLALLAMACGRSSTTRAVATTPTTAAQPLDAPLWAYGFTTPPDPSVPAAAAPGGGGRGGAGGGRGGAAPPVDTTRRTVAGSTQSFTSAQIRDTYGPADWFPGDHPTMPPIVARGRRDAMILACALCHYPNGKGRPENSSVSGLPVSYFMQTMRDFQRDARKSSDPRKANTARMIAMAKSMTDDELRAAAEYFGAIKWTPWIRVVERADVPKTRIAAGLFIPLEGAEAGTEPIGRRIIEVPENTEQSEVLRNPRSGFVAYVPPGSIAKGKALAARGQCALCHGAKLEGLGPVPGIAGRSPSYMVRQLFDMQTGARKGEWGALMRNAVAGLQSEELISLAAYVASLETR